MRGRKRKPTDGVNPLERRFCSEYLVDLSPREAAIRAGYGANGSTPETISVAASIALSRPHVKREIEKLLSERLRRIDLRADRALYEIANLAFSNMKDFVKVGEDGQPVLDFTNVNRDQWAAVQEYSEDVTGGSGDGVRAVVLRRKIKLSPKAPALEMLAKHFKLLTEKIEIDVSDSLIEKLTEARKRKELRVIAA